MIGVYVSFAAKKKTSEVWTARRRHATRKLVVEGGSVQERHKDIEWVDEKKCRGRGLTFCWREVETKSFKNERMTAEDPNFEGRLEVVERNRVRTL